MSVQLGVNAQKIVQACEGHWEAHKSNCSGFVRAVAQAVGITLPGGADEIVDAIRGDGWTKLGHDGSKAEQKAEGGWLVIVGLKGKDEVIPSGYGHVAVVVPGPLERGKYPTAYWGRLHGVGKKNATVNWAWKHADLGSVVYGGRPLPGGSPDFASPGIWLGQLQVPALRRYNSVSKHDGGPTPGRHGTIMDLPAVIALDILRAAVHDETTPPRDKAPSLWGYRCGTIYRFMWDNTSAWHGYPTSEKPPNAVLQRWRRDGTITEPEFGKILKYRNRGN